MAGEKKIALAGKKAECERTLRFIHIGDFPEASDFYGSQEIYLCN